MVVWGSHQLGLRIMACNTCVRVWVFLFVAFVIGVALLTAEQSMAREQ